MSAEPTLDEIEAAARALDTARQAYGAAMMRAFVQVENERYEATRKVAEMSHTIMLRDEKIATLTRERDEARADLARSVTAWESAGMQGRTAHDAMLALAKERDEARADAERYLADLRRCASEPYEHAKERAEAFRRGAEAMREACARWMSEREGIAQWVYDDALSALPIPEEP